MKSFFKKLAFVMALAMVVSMIAPAGSALAATTGVSLQGTKTIVDSWELDEVGATVDFSFQGAPSDWKSTYKWTSSNEAVATVDKAGIVTAVAAGTATITITAGADASYVETVVVTVKGASAGFEVAQANLTDFTMTFDAKKDVKAEDLEVVMIIGDVEAPIPVKSVAVNENVATVTLFSEFVDGVVYNVTYAGATQTFEGSIGEIDHVVFEYWTVKEGDGVAYVSTEEEPCVAKLTYKLFDANNVDVTAAYKEDELTIEYELANESEAYEIMDNEVTFYEAGAAVVNMNVTWTTDDADEVVKPFTGVVVATKRPAIAHTIAEAGFIVPAWYDADVAEATKAFTTNGESFFWKDNAYLNSWKLGDEGEFQFAALVKDNRGNTVVTGLNQPGNYAKNEDGDVIYPYGYFKFVTSNDEIVDIDDAGLITFWGVGSASIITYFVDTTGEEEKEVFVGSTKITVSPERYPASYAFASTTLTTATDSANWWWHQGGNYASNDLSLVLTVRDQYGDNIALANDELDIDVELKTDSEKIGDAVRVISSEGKCTTSWCGNSQGGYHYHIYFNGDAFDAYVEDDDTYKTIQYAVTLDKEANEKLSGSATSKVKVIVRNTDEYAGQLKNDTVTNKFYYYTDSAHSKSGADLVVNNTKNFKYTGNESLTKWVGVRTARLDKNDIWMEWLDSASLVELTKDQKTGEAGKLYFSVTGPKAAYNGDALKNWTYGVVNLDGAPTIGIKFNTEDEMVRPVYDKDGNLTSGTTLSAQGNYTGYAATGTYKVSLYYVKNTQIAGVQYGEETKYEGKLSPLSTYTFNVTNSQPDPKYAGYDAKLGNKTSEVLAAGMDEDDMLDIIKANLDFTYDGATINDWGGDFEISFPTKDIYDEEGNYVETVTDTSSFKVDAKKLRVNKVVITAKLDDGAGKTKTYTKTVSVGKTIYYEEEE